MSTHKELDPEGDSADAGWQDPFAAATTCTACGSTLDEDGDCPNADCSRSPYHLDEADEDDEEFEEGLLGEGDDDA